ncbi:hypothetical protein N7539_007184 [Penicillium diatomitis]|uniref:Phospholipase/carboxylesterase/thioesterase domain-containing protein n=1 Tax=Penicillium diatomitis TaxID=2819901 RepID=A0A9W9WUZ4_9EURO|nr:uncharacterized protein N7539_007184 [Penicillium diatomitis]KAJ5477040.1 hypothetical protein N7539_007184 [Penicillium diatomitis]
MDVGSTGLEFCEDLFSSVTPDLKSLPDALPSWRWVFPTSEIRYSSRFQEDESAWFEIWSLEYPDEQPELALEGLRESVSHILTIPMNEIEWVGGNASRVFLCGISQGLVTALWTFFCVIGQINQPLGGLIGFCGWLPFAQRAEDLMRKQHAMALLPAGMRGSSFAGLGRLDDTRAILQLFRDVLGLSGLAKLDPSTDISLLSTPAILNHGSDDPVVPIRLGRQAARVLQSLTVPTEWTYFSGAQANGH